MTMMTSPFVAQPMPLNRLMYRVIGALVPAIKAAHMDPVKSLRFE